LEYCNQCGKRANFGDNFCQNCGTPLKDINLNKTPNLMDKPIVDVKFKSKNAEALYRKSIEYINPKNLDIKKSFETLQMAYNIEPDNPLILSQLGLIYFTSGQVEDAINFLERALEIDPGNAIALEILLVVYKHEGDPEKVEKLFNQLKKKGPNYVESYINQGDKLFEEGSFDLATKSWKQALNLDPHNPEILMRLSAISEIDKRDEELKKFNGDYERAKNYYKQQIKEDPNNKRAKEMFLWAEKKSLGLKF
jgi:tetratricopeptide (TPR) repeat protein